MKKAIKTMVSLFAANREEETMRTEKYLKLVEYLDYLVIDNYDDELKLLDNIQPIVEKYKNCGKILL